MVLLPPEEALHGTLKDAESAVVTAAHEEGYAVSRFRSKKSKLGEIRKVWLSAVVAVGMQAVTKTALQARSDD